MLCSRYTVQQVRTKGFLTSDMRTWVQLVCGVATGSLDLFDLLLNNDFFVCHSDYPLLLISRSLYLDLFEGCLALSIATQKLIL